MPSQLAALPSVFGLLADAGLTWGIYHEDPTFFPEGVLDVVREVIETSSEHELDISAVVSIRSMLDDYLPTTLRAYLAIDPSQVNVVRPSGRTPAQSFIEQLDVLEASARDQLDAIRAHDDDALLSQGSFLRTKFAGSDLDL